jgi:hypothetical protein
MCKCCETELSLQKCKNEECNNIVTKKKGGKWLLYCCNECRRLGVTNQMVATKLSKKDPAILIPPKCKNELCNNLVMPRANKSKGWHLYCCEECEKEVVVLQKLNKIKELKEQDLHICSHPECDNELMYNVSKRRYPKFCSHKCKTDVDRRRYITESEIWHKNNIQQLINEGSNICIAEDCYNITEYSCELPTNVGNSRW